MSICVLTPAQRQLQQKMELLYGQLRRDLSCRFLDDLRKQLVAIFKSGRQSQFRAKLNSFKLFCQQQSKDQMAQDCTVLRGIAELVENEADCFQAFLPKLIELLSGLQMEPVPEEMPTPQNVPLRQLHETIKELENSLRSPHVDTSQDRVMQSLVRTPGARAEFTIKSKKDLELNTSQRVTWK